LNLILEHAVVAEELVNFLRFLEEAIREPLAFRFEILDSLLEGFCALVAALAVAPLGVAVLLAAFYL
jgi:hypothetical protein